MCVIHRDKIQTVDQKSDQFLLHAMNNANVCLSSFCEKNPQKIDGRHAFIVNEILCDVCQIPMLLMFLSPFPA